MLTKQTRAQFASKSSSATYYHTKGDAVEAFNSTLTPQKLTLDFSYTMQMHGDVGRTTVPILDCCNHVVGEAMLSWYRMPSGRWEFTGYIS